MPVFGNYPKCNFGCKYCFAGTEGFKQDAERCQPGSPEQVDRQLRATLESPSHRVHTIVSSRFHELFATDPQAGLDHVRKLAGYGRNVSVLTKAAPSPEIVDGLAEVDRQLQEGGNRLVVDVSFVSGEERPDLEVNAPTVQARVDATKLLADRDMCVGVCVSPVLPPEIASTEEIQALVERTIGHIRAYSIASRFIYTDEMAQRLGFEPSVDHLSNTTHGHSFPLMEDPSFTGWHVYRDPRVESILEKIRERDRGAFQCSLHTANHLIRTADVTQPKQGA